MGDRRDPRSRSNIMAGAGGPASKLVTAQDFSGAGDTSGCDSGLPPGGLHQRGMTLVQLTALYLVRARAPISLADLGRALGTDRPAASAIVDGLAHAGLVRWRPDRCHRGHVAVILTSTGEAIIDDPGPDTATRLRAALNDTSAACQSVLVC